MDIAAGLVESGIGDPNGGPSSKPLVGLEDARLIGLQCTFDVTDDDKDHDTLVDVSIDNNAVVMGSARLGGGEHWADGSQHVRGIPIVNAVTWDEGQHGKMIITIHPNGDDEWHFNVTLLMTFERDGWMRRGWTGVNLAEDRNSVTLNW